MPINNTRGRWRGRCIDNGEWVEGQFVPSNTNDGYRMYIIANAKWDNSDDGLDLLETDIYEVDPSTLGECTGLRDKNGKLIFEGDIVLAYYNSEEKTATGTIRYGKFMDTDSLDDYGYLGWYIEVQGHCISILQPEADGICIEVIGNIHDNPELLKGADKQCAHNSFDSSKTFSGIAEAMADQWTK